MIKDGINAMQQIFWVDEEIVNDIVFYLLAIDIVFVLDQGTAISRKVLVRLASLGHFPLDDLPQSVQVRYGDSLKIPCRSPKGIPNPDIYWTENSLTGSQYGSVPLSSRIQQDNLGSNNQLVPYNVVCQE